jgi:hypothetical protein
VSDRLGFAPLVAVTALFSVSVFAHEEATVVSGVTVDLTCGSHVALDAQSSATLEEETQALLQSSQSNSHLAEWHFPPAEVQEEFRGAIANAHLRVTFASIRTIPSVGGPLVVRDIIVRLGAEAPRVPFADRFVDSLFTVDEHGEVVGHALYSGTLLIALLTAVRDATAGTDECKVLKSVPGFS